MQLVIICILSGAENIGLRSGPRGRHGENQRALTGAPHRCPALSRAARPRWAERGQARRARLSRTRLSRMSRNSGLPVELVAGIALPLGGTWFARPLVAPELWNNHPLPSSDLSTPRLWELGQDRAEGRITAVKLASKRSHTPCMLRFLGQVCLALHPLIEILTLASTRGLPGAVTRYVPSARAADTSGRPPRHQKRRKNPRHWA